VRALPCRSEWLVGRGGAEVQGADQGVAGEDCDPDAVLEHGDGQLLVAAAEVDAQLGSDRARRSADGDARAGADAATVGLDLAGQWPVGMRALTLAANTAAGGAAAQARCGRRVLSCSANTARSRFRALCVRWGRRCSRGRSATSSALPEPLDRPAGLQVIRARGDRLAPAGCARCGSPPEVFAAGCDAIEVKCARVVLSRTLTFKERCSYDVTPGRCQ
jgi:hypothetical protein